jgi:GNAT superfamily N-acetyltransferase
MKLRQAVRSDIPAMHRIRLAVRENRLSSLAITEQSYVAEIEETGRGWLVELDGAVVGFCVANVQTGNVWALFVDPEHECRGYGRALHDAMISWLWAQGLDRLWLTTSPATRAERFYESAGWQRVRETGSGEILYELLRPG